ncbi:ABC transporter permease [candidate division KSB1 bacterium]
MLKNYIKTAVRNIIRNKIFSTINIAGLSIGILSSILITLYVIDELSYDSFFSNADRIYRLAYETEASVGQRNHYPSIGGGVGEQLKIDFPEIVSVVRIFKNTAGGTTWLVKDNERFREDNFFFADSSLFDVLDYEFLKGNPDNAFRVPNSLVITEAIEKKYFGSEDSINRTLGFELPNGTLIDLKVTGVLKDLPDNTHFHFDFLFPMSSVGNLFPGAPPRAIQNFLSNWQFTAFYTYFLAPENFDAELFEEKLPAFLNNHTTTRQREFIKGIYTQKLTDIHLRSNYLLNEIEPNSDIMYVYIFAVIAVMTIIVACINFMNLSTAKSANRVKEVGLRKVSGADRPDIIRQFLGESSLIAFIALIIAIIIVTISLPAFNGISGKEFDLGFLGDPVLITGLVVMTLFVGVLAG